MIITFNIGYETDAGGGILNSFPFIFTEFDNFKKFKEHIRNDDTYFQLYNWSHLRYVPKSSIILLISIQEDIDEDEFWNWDFKVRMKNVKGYLEYCKQFKSNDEFEDCKKCKLREDKINDILD